MGWFWNSAESSGPTKTGSVEPKDGESSGSDEPINSEKEDLMSWLDDNTETLNPEFYTVDSTTKYVYILTIKTDFIRTLPTRNHPIELAFSDVNKAISHAKKHIWELYDVTDYPLDFVENNDGFTLSKITTKRWHLFETYEPLITVNIRPIEFYISKNNS